MIKVKFRFDDKAFTYLSCEGHSGSADIGQDLICAGASSIMFGLLNAIDMVDEQVETNIYDNKIEVINYSDNEKINNYLELAILQLKTIEESYSQYIKIDERREQR